MFLARSLLSIPMLPLCRPQSHSARLAISVLACGNRPSVVVLGALLLPSNRVPNNVDQRRYWWECIIMLRRVVSRESLMRSWL